MAPLASLRFVPLRLASDLQNATTIALLCLLCLPPATVRATANYDFASASGLLTGGPVWLGRCAPA